MRTHRLLWRVQSGRMNSLLPSAMEIYKQTPEDSGYARFDSA